MMFPDFGYGETVTYHRYTGNTKDENGYRTNGFAEPVEMQNVGVDVPTVAEPRDGTTQLSQTDLVLFLPADFQSNAQDRFTVRGRLYEAEGIGEPIRNFFTGDVYRTEVRVRRIHGQED